MKVMLHAGSLANEWHVETDRLMLIGGVHAVWQNTLDPTEICIPVLHKQARVRQTGLGPELTLECI